MIKTRLKVFFRTTKILSFYDLKALNKAKKFYKNNRIKYEILNF